MSVREITHDYETEITKESLPVVVEFYAKWCPKCAIMKDIIERLARRYEGILVFKKVDIDKLVETAKYLGIDIVPTFVLYRQGEILGYTTGVLSEEVLEERVAEMLE